ncbi:phosphomevalonate kinase [Candidatus Dependentiae bacterium]|nr:phosphomevalonate kinase [Candidatus Dependentiae bacterium]
MYKKTIQVKVPGKIILSGEWSILQPGNSCIVIAVDKYVFLKISQSRKIKISANDIDLKNVLSEIKNYKLIFKSKLTKSQKLKLKLCKKSIEIACKYLSENNIAIKNFNLNINSQISNFTLPNGKTKKIGLGSSSAIVVAIISGLLKFHNFKIQSKKIKNIIFKLSSIAHYIKQNKVGSCADIAACTFQKPLEYKRFDPSWFNQQIKTKKLNFIVNIKWPNLKIKPIQLPSDLKINIGFVGFSSSTKNLINQISKNNPNLLSKNFFKINQIVKKLLQSFKQSENPSQKSEILNLINQNRNFLKKIDTKLEPPKLKKMIQLANLTGAEAKFSGAGGGDCVIAINFDKTTESKINQLWQKNSFFPLKINMLR